MPVTLQRGDFARVLSEASAYYLVTGRVAEVIPHNGYLIEFTAAQLGRARDVARVRGGKVHRVPFYQENLQRVIYD